MDQDADFDRTWWDIETLLKWIDAEEVAGLAEIERKADRLGLTGQLGPLDRGFGALQPRETIPEIEFADCVLRKVAGRYVYLPNPETITMQYMGGWQYLRLRADKARAVWPGKKRASGVTHNPRKRGPPGEVMRRVVAKMRSDIQKKQLTLEALEAYKEEALAVQYEASRTTVRKARDLVLSLASDN
jgi:hypothetical protein